MLSDKAKEIVGDVEAVGDSLVKFALVPFLVLSDSVAIHVVDQVGYLDCAPSQCQLLDGGASKEFDRRTAQLSITRDVEIANFANSKVYVLFTPRNNFVLAQIHIFETWQ